MHSEASGTAHTIRGVFWDVALERSRAFLGTPGDADPSEYWLVKGRDATGTVLFSHRTRLGRWDYLLDIRPLSIAIPLSPTAEGALETISVIGPRGERASRVFTSTNPQ